MEPLRLNLLNFLSYRSETIDLATVSCASLVGDNGAGKSSLLDALTWALFGQGTKGRDLDNYVTTGESECQIGLDFRLNGQIYRVVRGRSSARGKSALEFFVLDIDSWRPISGKSISDTQSIIDSTLRMDYRTFTASSLILQGQADAFTANMTDAERKEALARILGLDIWDKLQERARETLRVFKAELSTITQTRDRLTNVTTSKVRHLTRQAELLECLKLLTSDIAKTEEQMASLSIQIQRVPELERRVGETEERIAHLKHNSQTCLTDIRTIEERVTQLSAAIVSCAELTMRREEIDQAVKLEEAIAQDVSDLDVKAQEHLNLTTQLRDLQRNHDIWAGDVSSEIARLEASIASASEQAKVMEKVPCTNDTKATCPLLQMARKAAVQVQTLSTRLASLKDSKNPHREPLQTLSERLKALAYDQESHQGARRALEGVKKTSQLKAKLDAAEQRAKDLHEQKQELELNKQRLTEQRSSIGSEIEDLLHSLNGIKAELIALHPQKEELKRVKSNLSHHREQESQARVELGRVENSLEQVASAEAEMQELEARAKALAEQQTIYEIIDQACGQKAGVPALIVENSVPEIERLANDMLAKMAGGRLAVRLDTQVAGKSTGAMQEVLRITVLDGGMERPYQTYSGAERFMVDLALRVALSKFLAHRAGAEIKLFVLDEGLGSCDQTNRIAVMQAIQTVAQEFSKTLVITHINELQDALPQRIEIFKGPDGSKVRIA